jgi:hypothetical protein
MFLHFLAYLFIFVIFHIQSRFPRTASVYGPLYWTWSYYSEWWKLKILSNFNVFQSHGCAMAQALATGISPRRLRFDFRQSFETCDGRSGPGTENSVIPVRRISTMLHIHLHLHPALNRKYKLANAL